MPKAINYEPGKVRIRNLNDMKLYICKVLWNMAQKSTPVRFQANSVCFVNG